MDLPSWWGGLYIWNMIHSHFLTFFLLMESCVSWLAVARFSDPHRSVRCFSSHFALMSSPSILNHIHTHIYINTYTHIPS